MAGKLNSTVLLLKPVFELRVRVDWQESCDFDGGGQRDNLEAFS
jgi:hypothetical protein